MSGGQVGEIEALDVFSLESTEAFRRMSFTCNIVDLEFRARVFRDEKLQMNNAIRRVWK